MPPLKPGELPPPDQVQAWLEALPSAERHSALAGAERRAKARGDEELLRAIAQWRLRHELQATARIRP
jgi:hypothetical protein